MSITRREFTTGLCAATGLAPVAARAAGHGGDAFMTDAGDVLIHPINHASIVMETPAGTLYVDPVGRPDAYEGLPPADLILVTHEHGDHLSVPLLMTLAAGGVPLITNPAVQGMLPGGLGDAATALANGDSTEALGIGVEAIPAYNITEDRLRFHPQGRDNGYVLGLGGKRVYISGDTEGIPEMRSLDGIDLAFVCMNLPFTMDVEQAADAVAEFAPAVVYPYHYRGREDGTQDPAEFAELLAATGSTTEVRFGDWYG